MTMDTASTQFVLFGLAAAILSNLSSSRAWRAGVLMLASLCMLALIAKSPLDFLPLAAFLVLGYAVLTMVRKRTVASLFWAVPAIILAYIWLKKYTFIPSRTYLDFPYLTLGLSYIFFRVLHLIIEMNGSDEKKLIGPGAYLLYMLNFTTFISGPIQRYDEFARDQLAIEPISLGGRVIALQLERIVRGFFKVNVLAMFLNLARVNALAQIGQPLPQSFRLLAAFRLAVVYPLFLYANFSGYIDIVIALARLMRLRLPENFDRPFSASSFLDFWNRWHITLSTWLKTYVYNPLLLTLMRRISSVALEPLLGVFCFFVTFFLVGLWHGRTTEFIFFGILQGGGVAINKLWQVTLARALGRKGYKDLAKDSFYVAFGRGLTYSWFAFTLFWFWSDWKQIDVVYKSLGMRNWALVWLVVWFASTAVLAFWEWLRGVLLSIRMTDEPVLTNRYALVVYATSRGLAALVLTVLLNQPAPDIVYKSF